MDIRGNQFVEHMVKFSKKPFYMLLHSRHLFFCIKLWLALLLGGPEGSLLFCPIRVQKDLKIYILIRQLVKQADVIIQPHQHRIQAGRPAVRMFPFQPLSVLNPPLQLFQPVCIQLGHSSLIHLKYQIYRMIVDPVRELGKGSIGRILFRFWAKNHPKAFQPLLIDRYTGNGTLFIICILIQSLLESLISIRVDPMIFHLFQWRAIFNFFFQSKELIIVRFQCKTMGNRLQRARFISKVAAQLTCL